MNKSVSDALLKYGPLIFTFLSGLLSKMKEDKDKADLIDQITKGVLKGLKK